MAKSEGYVEVSLRLPKKIVQFLKAMELNLGMTMEEYLESSIIAVVGADMDSLETFAPDPEALIGKFELQDLLKDTAAACFC